MKKNKFNLRAFNLHISKKHTMFVSWGSPVQPLNSILHSLHHLYKNVSWKSIPSEASNLSEAINSRPFMEAEDMPKCSQELLSTRPRSQPDQSSNFQCSEGKEANDAF
jgi:hypothetical protein